MDLKSFATYSLVFLAGVLVASIKDIGKETVGWMFKEISYRIKQKLIEVGKLTGDFPIDVGKFFESTKEPITSEWSIRINSRYDKRIGKCRVLLNGKELRWWNKKERYDLSIEPYGSGNVRIPKDDSIKGTRVQVWNGKNILFNNKFEDLPLLDE